jgi:hypothetical protein
MHCHSVVFGDTHMRHVAPLPLDGQQAASSDEFQPLEHVARTHVPTEQAAFYPNRRPQTLREWAMTGKVITPLRVNGRLAWPVADIRRVLEVT